jgi:hypothetical protein
MESGEGLLKQLVGEQSLEVAIPIGCFQLQKCFYPVKRLIVGW